MGADGKVPAVTLHQNGRDQRANRTDPAQAAAVQRALAKRIEEQTPAAGAKEALRRNIEELRAGEPKYDLMSPRLADVTRRQLPRLQQMIKDLGAIESATFEKVDAGGADIFEVKFEHGMTEWWIMMQTEEKIAGVGVRRL